MNSLQFVARVAPCGARALCMTSRLGSVSMKQSFEEASSKGVVPSSERYQRVRALQNEFHANADKLVWQKRGTRDTVPYYLTFLACGSGIALALWTIYDMSFPKIPSE